MLSPSPLKSNIPSTSLLRFLRSQSDSLLYFTANPSTCDLPTRKSSRSRPSRVLQLESASNWTHLNPARCQATLEAGLLPSLRKSQGQSQGPSRNRTSLGQRPCAVLSPLSQLSSRASSSHSRPLLRRLFDLRRSKAAAETKQRTPGPALIDEGTEGSLNFGGRLLAAKASNEPRLRCTEFDSNGNVTLVNGDFRKSELIAKVRFAFVVEGHAALNTDMNFT